MKINDLNEMLAAAANELAIEYKRISRRVGEDPGTAGDQGEENWSKVLSEWLPPTFQIVTKGRIINFKGQSSPQVDIIVLRPEYPKGLLNKKYYLADGVLAAFECKLTLKNTDLNKFFKNSEIIKSLLPELDKKTIYDEIQSPIFYGLLAHSYRGKTSKLPLQLLESSIAKSTEKTLHPILLPDCICVADFASWHIIKYPLPTTYPEFDIKEKFVSASYMCEQYPSDDLEPIASMLNWLLFRLSKGDQGLWNISRYFMRALQNTAKGFSYYWPAEVVYSKKSLSELEKIQKAFAKGIYNFPDDFKFLASPPP